MLLLLLTLACRTGPSDGDGTSLPGDDTGTPTEDGGTTGGTDSGTDCTELPWYVDGDDDGFGDDADVLWACTQPTGTVATGGDCDDDDPAVGPRVDGWLDRDLDGWGGEALSTCTPPDAFATQGGDCDDLDPLTWPGAPELCDGLDQDCDLSTDEDATDALAWTEDTDGDGHGDDSTTTWACQAPEGMVAAGGDCAPEDPSVHPDAAETCGNGADDGRDDLAMGAGDEGESSAEAGVVYRVAEAPGDGDRARRPRRKSCR